MFRVGYREDCGGSLVSGEEEPRELLVTAEVPPVWPFSSASEGRGLPSWDEIDLS